jgi:hypothetical protein
MSPWIRDADVLTIRPRRVGVNPAPRIGDIVAFRQADPDRLLVHRLVARVRGGWIARGDRCGAPDGFVPEACVLGKVTCATNGGRRRLLPQGGAGFFLSAASRLALRARDRIRQPWAADEAGAGGA